MQRKLLISTGALGAAIITALVLVVPTLATPVPHHVPSARPNPFALEHPHGPAISQPTANAAATYTPSCGAAATVHNRVVDVKVNVTNDADSGLAGNYWAFDTLTRTLQIYQLSDNTWCATVTDRGTFDAIAEQTSPGKGGTLTGDESGKIVGGYSTTNFTGTFALSDPANWSTHGNVRPKPIDYQCDVSGNCPGYISWVSQYFSNTTGFDLADWSWTYTAQDKADGVWVNAASGTYGDILDQD